jgi:GcrA cell cycle regulator
MEPSNWAPAHSDALRKYFAMGMSYAEIARAINAEFKTHYSRCAAIGRAKRLGLGSDRLPGERVQAPPLAPVAPKAESSNLYKMVRSEKALVEWLARLGHRKEMPELRCAAVEPRGLSLIELEAGDCRYPYGGDAEGEAIRFCGHPKRKGESYCAAYFHLTRNPDVVTQRAVETPSRSRRYPVSRFQGSH